MCKALNKRGKICRLHPAKDLCHIHKVRADLAMLSEFKVSSTHIIERLSQDNTMLIASSELLFAESERLEDELKRATKSQQKATKLQQNKATELPRGSYGAPPSTAKSQQKINDLEREVARLTERLAESTKLNNRMRSDYDSYQIIKSFEGLHQQMESIEFNRRGNLYHDLRLTRNQVAHPSA